ncbi:hypothetical protein CFP56_028508 [Quercus suber]|uniref:Uncharacterized protein n=1 Tax=Quercus suber TaxID=58331 RepID=A0AAW0JTV3_QUESU
MFAAAIIVPGGNDSNTGLPMFLNSKKDDYRPFYPYLPDSNLDDNFLCLSFHHSTWMVIPVICLAGVPVALFTLTQFRVLITCSTQLVDLESLTGIWTLGPKIYKRRWPNTSRIDHGDPQRVG